LVDGGFKTLVLVEVETDAGITGLGEATIGNKARAAAACVDELARYLVGKDPFRIEHHWQAMRINAFSGGTIIDTAISALEIAMWDILGKALGTPVFQLLGGACRDRIRVYASGWWPMDDARPESIAARAQKLAEEGFTALKLVCHGPYGTHVVGPSVLRDAVAQVRAVREAVGAEVDILIDMHGRLQPEDAVYFAKAVEEYHPMWLEEPVLPGEMDGLKMVQAASSVPLATGERLHTKHEFHELIAQRAVGIIQPDVIHAGGILELKKLAAMAEARYMTIAPHNAAGPVATAATMHLAACTPNFLILELWDPFLPWPEDLVAQPLRPVDGYLPLPQGPGLGVTLNREGIARHPAKPATDYPLWFRTDGSITMW
jgi:galactonate dehydratase